MHVDNFDALRIWLTKVLTHICEAEPATLSKYVCILVKKDVKGRDPKGFFTEQLEVFLQDETSGFIDKLFKALESKEYMSEEILSELNERKEKKDKKRSKTEKSEKGIEKSGEKAPHHHRHRQASRHSQSSNGGGLPSGGGGDLDRPGSFPSPVRHRTPSPAPRRHRQSAKSRSRSPVHRRRRDSRESYNERNSHGESDLSTNPTSTTSSVSPPNAAVPQLYDSGHAQSLRTQSTQAVKTLQPGNAALTPITPLMSTVTAYNPQPKTVSSLRASTTASTSSVGYTPSVVPTPRARERCRDFDEKGFCMRGDLCPFDHGVDPVVVENVNLTKVLAFPAQAPKPPTVEPAPPVREPLAEEPKRAEAKEQTEISTVQPQDRGRPRPMIVRPAGNVLRNVVEVPLVDDRPEAPPVVGPPEKEEKEAPKDCFEWRGVRFNSNGNNNNNNNSSSNHGESSCVDLRAKLGGGRGGRSVGGFRERRGFHHGGGNRGGSHGGGNGPEGSSSLGVTQIPPDLNAIGPLNSHFSQFGEVMNIQVCFGGDPRNALVTFKTAVEAMEAYRSPEPILKNRFIRTYLHNDSSNRGRGRGRGRGMYRGMDNSGHRVPVKRRLGFGCGPKEESEEGPSAGGRSPKRRLHHRLGRNFDESSSESDDDWGVPEQDAEPRRHLILADDSNGGDNDVTTSGLSMQEAMEEARHKEEVAQRQEAAAQMRAQQLEALEKVRKKKELRLQEVLLYNKAREQQKFLQKKSSDYAADSPLKTQIQAMIDSVEKTLARMERDLGVEEDASKQIQAMQRRCLETECEVYAREQSKQDASEQKRRLADIQRRVAMMKEKAAAGAGLFPSRGQTKLDKRPRSLMISAVNEDVSAKAILHNICCTGVQVEKYEYYDNDKRLHVTCRTRQDAEFISNQMHTYKGKSLRIEWVQCSGEKFSTSSMDAQTRKSCSSPPREGSTSANAPPSEETNGGTDPEAGAEDDSCRGETSKTSDFCPPGSDPFVEDDPETCDMDDPAFEDDYDPDFDEDYDPEFDPNFQHSMSPIVITANSDNSDNDGEDDGDEEEEGEGEEEPEEIEGDAGLL